MFHYNLKTGRIDLKSGIIGLITYAYVSSKTLFEFVNKINVHRLKMCNQISLKILKLLFFYNFIPLIFLLKRNNSLVKEGLLIQ